MSADKADYLTMTMDRQGVAVRLTAVERTIVDRNSPAVPKKS